MVSIEYLKPSYVNKLDYEKAQEIESRVKQIKKLSNMGSACICGLASLGGVCLTAAEFSHNEFIVESVYKFMGLGCLGFGVTMLTLEYLLYSSYDNTLSRLYSRFPQLKTNSEQIKVSGLEKLAQQ